jgi:hypothetical protein
MRFKGGGASSAQDSLHRQIRYAGKAMTLRINGTLRRALASLLLVTCSWSSAESIEAPRTGYFKLEFPPEELLGEQGVIGAADILRSDENLSWQLYVPDTYDATRPAGVVVYISPTRKGGPPRIWNEPLVDKNLIWIGANDAGNRVGVGKRMFLAMLAPKILANEYVLDADRIYVAGFSGGGKTASRVAVARPEVFRGGIYIAGAEAWGTTTPPPKLDIIRQNYHVFLTGTNDFNERLTRRVYASYKGAGVENCELIVVKRLGHELPGRSVFIRAIDYLDSRRSSDSNPT